MCGGGGGGMRGTRVVCGWVGAMHGGGCGGHAWQGVCVAGGGGGMHSRRDGHCSVRYPSYWNALFFDVMNTK